MVRWVNSPSSVVICTTRDHALNVAACGSCQTNMAITGTSIVWRYMGESNRLVGRLTDGFSVGKFDILRAINGDGFSPRREFCSLSSMAQNSVLSEPASRD
jgi:hypothetical protein